MNDGNANSEDDEERIGDPDQFSAQERWVDIESDRFEDPKSDGKKEKDNVDKLLFFNGVHDDEYSEEYGKRASCKKFEESF